MEMSIKSLSMRLSLKTFTMSLHMIMMDKSKDHKQQESDFPLEVLRKKRTELTQDEFVFKCGFTRSTYRRHMHGEMEMRLTPSQMAAICRETKLSPWELLEQLGADLTGVPIKPVEAKA